MLAWLGKRGFVRAVRRHIVRKGTAELRFWHSRHRIDGGRFENSSYERLMLAIAGERDASFVAGKVVADFGCGPRGSLLWATSAVARIGIDVLASVYADAFPDDIRSHGMIYVTGTELVIPLPDASVDIMFSVNAFDHTADFPAACSEIVRVLKPGGILAASLNLDEPPTAEEPQTLSEATIQRHLLANLDVESYRCADKLSGDIYGPLIRGDELTRTPGKPGLLWVRARKADPSPL